MVLRALVMAVWLPLSATASPIPPPVSGRPVDETTTLPADVLARVRLVAQHVDLLCLEMGVAPAHDAGFRVDDASARDVYFLGAMNLFRRADRLAFEVARVRSAAPLRPAGELRPAHVFRVVDAALGRILEVRAALGVTEPVEEKPEPTSATPSDVVNALRILNRSLDRLLMIIGTQHCGK